MIRNLQTADAKWRTAKGQLELQLPKETFNTWLRNADLIAHENGTFIIGVENVYARDWLEHRLKKNILRTLSSICNHQVDIRFAVRPSSKKEVDSSIRTLRKEAPLLAEIRKNENKREFHPQIKASSNTGLNPVLTFESFITGSCNDLATAAASAIADGGRNQFNPLFIHSTVGQGKTHLLNALGNKVQSQGRQVKFLTAEAFTNELIKSIQTKKTDKFRNTYRILDMLILDDIEFIIGKKSTQEELFHTFNSLMNSNAAIIAAGHLPPGEMKGLDKRLASRLEGGLVVELLPPDKKTRLTITSNKLKLNGFSSIECGEILNTISNQTYPSIRDLEGAVNRIIAMNMLSDEKLSIEQTVGIIKDQKQERTRLNLADIAYAVSRFYSVSKEAIRGRGRKREISTARQIVMYIARVEADLSLKEIGEYLDGRNHSTVLYNVEKVEDLMAADSRLKREVKTILDTLCNVSEIISEESEFTVVEEMVESLRAKL